MKSETKEISREELIKMGWDALVKELGIVNATRYIIETERGYGDSVKEIDKIWEGVETVDEAYELIQEWKKSDKFKN